MATCYLLSLLFSIMIKAFSYVCGLTVLLGHNFPLYCYMYKSAHELVCTQSHKNIVSSEESLQTRNSYAPVSYTHLDVYKRQPPSSQAGVSSVALKYVPETSGEDLNYALSGVQLRMKIFRDRFCNTKTEASTRQRALVGNGAFC